MPLPLIIIISAIVLISLIGLVIFSWRNSKAVIHPSLIPAAREIESNKKRGLWGDFDSYRKTEYEIKGKDGYILHAVSVDTKDTRGTGKYVIICHGHTSSRYGAVKYVNCYVKLGFSCVIYDARTHGINAPDKCTLGYVESEDLMHVIDDTRSKFSDIKVLGIQGESMGSSAAIHSLRFDTKIDFIVADCGFMSTHEVIYDCYRNIHMQFLVPFIRLAGRIIYRVDLDNTNAMRYLENNKTPILFIHGAGDTFIKPYQSKKMKEKAAEGGAYTDLILVEGAGHAKSCAVAGIETYTGYIENFLSKIGI